MNAKNRVGLMGSVLVLFLSVSACGSGSSDAANEVVIGGLHPRTGPASYYGLPMDRGAELAISEINEAGGVKVGGASVMLKYTAVDDKSDPTAGVAALKRLTTDGVDFVVGPLGSAVLQALVPIVQNSDTLLLIDGAADPSPDLLTPKNIFRLPPSTAGLDSALVDVVVDQEFSTLAILNDEANPTYAGSLDTVVEGIEAGGSEVVGTATFSTGDSDFKAQLTGLLSGTQPEAIVVRGYALESATLTEQARELGYDGRIMWEVLAPPETVKSAVPEAALDGVVNVVYATPDFYEKLGNEEVAKFNASYEKKFDEAPGSLSAFAYDGIKALAAAMESANSTDPEKVAEALADLKMSDLDLLNAYEPYDGALFDDTGQARVIPSAMVWKDGDWFPFEEARP